MQIDNVISKGQLVPLVFTQDAVAANQSATAMNIVETGATSGILGATEYPIPWDFEIVGVSILSDTDLTANTMTADATINGTATGLQAVLSDTVQRTSTVQARGKDVGVAGDRVGCKLASHASLAPETCDVVVVVWVMVYLNQALTNSI